MSNRNTASSSQEKPTKNPTMKSEATVTDARQKVPEMKTVQLKYFGPNKHFVSKKSNTKLDSETDELKHGKVSLEVGKAIMQARQAKKLSQKDLAAMICEKQQVITDYEIGRGISNNLVLSKIERALDTKVRGKNRGNPVLTPRPKKK